MGLLGLYHWNMVSSVIDRNNISGLFYIHILGQDYFHSPGILEVKVWEGSGIQLYIYKGEGL